jgi:hypothetical protein
MIKMLWTIAETANKQKLKKKKKKKKKKKTHQIYQISPSKNRKFIYKSHTLISLIHLCFK